MRQLLIEAIQPRLGRGGWHGGPTPLGALRGLDWRAAAWVPAKGRKSIWQLVLHVAYWKYAVARRLSGGTAGQFGRSPANWPAVPARPSKSAWDADVALLAESHRRLLEAVAAVPESHYGRRLSSGKRWTRGELIVGIAMHDAYHAGQIQMLKRLYAALR